MSKPAKKHAIKISEKKPSKAKVKLPKKAQAAKAKPVAAETNGNGSHAPLQNGHAHPRATKSGRKKPSVAPVIAPAVRGALNLDAPEIQEKLRELVKLAKE